MGLLPHDLETQVVRRDMRRIKAAPIVGDGQPYDLLQAKRHGGLRGLGMFHDVIQRLLRDAVGAT